MSLKNLFIPPLFALSFVLVLFNSNINQIFLSALFMPAIFIFLTTLLVSCLVFLLSKNKEKSMLYLSVFVVLFFSYSEILACSPAAEYSVWLLHFSDRTMALGLELIVFVLIFLLIRHTSKASSLLRFLQIMAVIMVIMPLIQIVPFEMRHFFQSSKYVTAVIPALDPSKISKKPDIYYIVPEDYSSATVMKQFFNADISDFNDFLTEKGFYVATQSSSNYPKSFLSIASALNLSYLDNLAVYKNSSDQDLATPLLNNSETNLCPEAISSFFSCS